MTNKQIPDKPWVEVIGDYSNGDLAVSARCINCDKVEMFTFKPENWNHWISGGLIQNCFTNLSVDECELLISGLCGTCFPY